MMLYDAVEAESQDMCQPRVIDTPHRQPYYFLFVKREEAEQ